MNEKTKLLNKERFRKYISQKKADLQQFWWKWKYRFKRSGEKTLASNLLGNIVISGLYSLAIMGALSLFYPYSLKLFLASVGVYFVMEELLSRADNWFANFRGK